MARAAPGAYSLDAVLGITLAQPATLVIGLVLVALGITSALLRKPRQPVAARTAQLAS